MAVKFVCRVRKGGEVPEVKWCKPGEDEAMEVLLGKKNGFLTTRIKNYADDRNDPSKPSGLSGLSPYLHYGHISAQRCALEARKLRSSHTKVLRHQFNSQCHISFSLRRFSRFIS